VTRLRVIDRIWRIVKGDPSVTFANSRSLACVYRNPIAGLTAVKPSLTASLQPRRRNSSVSLYLIRQRGLTGKTKSVTEGLNGLAVRRPVDEAEPEGWVKSDPDRRQARRIDEIEAINRFDECAGGIEDLDAAAAGAGAGKFLGNQKQLVYSVEHDRLPPGE
jgi:hypothetical protein